MSSPAYDLAYYIAVTLNKGELGVNVFVDGVQDSPDDQVVAYEYGEIRLVPDQPGYLGIVFTIEATEDEQAVLYASTST